MTDPTADQTNAPERVPSGCPVIHLDASAPLEAGSHWLKANELRETSPAFFNTHAQGYWVFTRYDEVREMYQHPEIFSSESITPGTRSRRTGSCRPRSTRPTTPSTGS